MDHKLNSDPLYLCKYKTIKLLGGKKRKSSRLRTRQRFLKLDSKTTICKKKIDKLEFIKLRNANHTIKG